MSQATTSLTTYTPYDPITVPNELLAVLPRFDGVTTAQALATLYGLVQQQAALLSYADGFQILTESGLLPGALMRNAGLKYICKQVHLRVEWRAKCRFRSRLRK